MTWLFNRQTGLYEPAELLDRIETVDIACYQEHWQPPMRAKIDELKAASQYNRATVSACNLEDAHWQWPKKCQERIGKLEWISAAIRCAGKTQGLMYASLVQQCRLPGLHKKHLVYIDLVSTAPWNRPRLNQNPLYGGVGSTSPRFQ